MFYSSCRWNCRYSRSRTSVYLRSVYLFKILWITRRFSTICSNYWCIWKRFIKTYTWQSQRVWYRYTISSGPGVWRCIHFENASIITINILPSTGPKKSKCIRWDGPSGQGQLCKTFLGGLLLSAKQALQLFVMFWIPLSIPGHQIYDLATDFILTVLIRVWCNSFNNSFRILPCTTILCPMSPQ